MSELRRLLGYLRPYRGRLGAAVLASAATALFTAALAVLVSPLVEELKPAAERDPTALHWLGAFGHAPVYSLILIAFIGKGVFSYVSQYLMSWIGQRAVMDLRSDVGASVLRQSVSFFSEEPPGALIARITSDAEKVLTALSEKLYDVVREPLTMVALGSYLFWLDWRLAAIALVVTPAIVLPVSRLGRKLRRASEKSQQTIGELANRLHEVVRGIRVVKSSGTEELETERLRHLSRAIFDANMRSVKVVAATPPAMEMLAGIGIAAAFFYGQARIEARAMSSGDFLSFMTALLMLYTPGKKLSRVQAAFEQAIASAARCFEVVDRPVDVVDIPGALPLRHVKGEIAIEKLSFRYHEQDVLRDLDVTIPAGALVALVGRSGSGKTTLANLILRFYDPTAGRITLDGRDLRSISLRSLRRHVGIVAQDVVLFSGTLRENIAYGVPDATPAQVEAAARAACADEFILPLPQGYDARVGEGGLKLSTGQRQRIAIARALLKDPPVLILDEATSALDAESESLVVRALGNLMQGRTTLVIAHRLATVRRADRILVLEDGRLREEGTHDELVRKDGGLYNRLAELQALGEVQE